MRHEFVNNLYVAPFYSEPPFSAGWTVRVQHPENADSIARVDTTSSVFDADVLSACLEVLNRGIAEWPVAPVVAETVTARARQWMEQ